MLNIKNRSIASLFLAFAFFISTPALASGYGYKKPNTVLDKLVQTDGAQAVVAAVLVVDEAGVLHFSLAEILGDKNAEVVLFAPSNAAFEQLLGLDPGTLDGLNIEQVKAALPGFLPEGVGAGEVASILLKHVALPKRATLWTASDLALLKKGTVQVADESIFPVSVTASGVGVNYETTIIRANINARNGVIHFIDTVITDGLLQ
jgi:uncharacterized surface protein with fasciclin (FAS1) repeats